MTWFIDITSLDCSVIRTDSSHRFNVLVTHWF